MTAFATARTAPVDPALSTAVQPAVCSYNEWDLLEEVIVGVLDHAAIPSPHLALQATMPGVGLDMFRTHAGEPFPGYLVDAGNRELDRLAAVLRTEGVIVRRPERLDHSRPFATPDWSEPCGIYAAMPRDVALVIGDEIIEAPMAWRSRYFEIHAYRKLFQEYFARGARWSAAPRPILKDETYNADYERAAEAGRFAVTDQEPTFDAADFTRCGEDIFVQRSHVTNGPGIEWLRRHLGGRFRVHEVAFNDPSPMHIDATLVPLAPGKLLINPERVHVVPPIFRGWDVLAAPQPCIPDGHPMFMSSTWISMNILMLDERRVVVERSEEPLIRQMKDWGFQPVPCDFRAFNTFGGSFHCATLDVRRRGELQCYF